MTLSGKIYENCVSYLISQDTCVCARISCTIPDEKKRLKGKSEFVLAFLFKSLFFLVSLSYNRNYKIIGIPYNRNTENMPLSMNFTALWWRTL